MDLCSYNDHSLLHFNSISTPFQLPFNSLSTPLFTPTDQMSAAPLENVFLSGHEKAITALEVINDLILSKLPDLKVIGKYGVGLDMIDLQVKQNYLIPFKIQMYEGEHAKLRDFFDENETLTDTIVSAVGEQARVIK